MKILCLVDGNVVPPDRWMWNHLPEEYQNDQVDFLGASPPDHFPRWGKLLTYYPFFFKQSIEALLRCRKYSYDLVVAWESKIGFPLAVLRTLLGIRKPRLLILAFSYKGIALNFLPFGRFLIRSVDHITVPGSGEVDYYSRLLKFPKERITFVPLGGYEVTLTESEEPTNSFIFAGGRSDRDYGTLFRAVDGLEIPVVINARKFNVQGLKCPANVTVNKIMPSHQYFQLIHDARFVVVPLQPAKHAAGLISILQAMSIGKAVIVTRSQSAADYVEDGKTGILVTPADPEALRQAILYLWENPAVARKMGEEAQQRYHASFDSKAFAMRNYRVIQKLVSNGSTRS